MNPWCKQKLTTVAGILNPTGHVFGDAGCPKRWDHFRSTHLDRQWILAQLAQSMNAELLHVTSNAVMRNSKDLNVDIRGNTVALRTHLCAISERKNNPHLSSTKSLCNWLLLMCLGTCFWEGCSEGSLSWLVARTLSRENVSTHRAAQ